MEEKMLEFSLDDPGQVQGLFGVRNENVKRIEQQLGVEIHVRGDAARIHGERHAVDLARRLLEDLHKIQQKGGPIHPTDERDMRDLFYELSEQSKFYRFMSQIKRVPRSQIEDFVYVDHRSEVTIVGVLKEAHGEDIIAVGSYYLDTKTNKAEVAFTVIDQWQRRGIGTYMLKFLAQIARRNGISGFTAEVLPENKGMQAVFNHSEFKVSSHHHGDVCSYALDFE